MFSEVKSTPLPLSLSIPTSFPQIEKKPSHEDESKQKKEPLLSTRTKKTMLCALPLIVGAGIYGLKKLIDRIIACSNPKFTDEFSSLKRDVQNEFDYTSRNLNVELELKGKNISDTQISQLTQALLEGNWQADVFKDDKSFPYIALQAFKEKKIGKEEFTNVMFYWSIRQHHPAEEIQVVSLYDSCQCVNQQAATALMATMQPTPVLQTHFGKNIPKEQLPEEPKPFMDQVQQEQFISRLKALPRSAQTFFIIPDIQANYQSNLPNMMNDIVEGKITISQEIQKSPRVNVFNRIEWNGQSMRMVPSFEMMQEAVKVMSGPHSVTILPTIGLSQIEEIRKNGLTSTRDMGIPFPGLNLPKTADTLRCTELYDFFYHDFYHAIQASCVPHVDRIKFIKFADVALEITKGLKQNNKEALMAGLSKEIQERLLDMEHPIYNPINHDAYSTMYSQYNEKIGNDFSSYRFFASIDVVMLNAIGRLSIYQAQKKGASTDPYASLKFQTYLTEEMACSQFPRKLIQKFVQTFSNNKEAGKNFCKRMIDWGNLTEKLFRPMMLIDGSSLSDYVNHNWALQGRELCSNPWLLASVAPQLL